MRLRRTLVTLLLAPAAVPVVAVEPDRQPLIEQGGGVWSIAERDWKPRSELSPEQAARIPLYCPGAYVLPENLDFRDPFPNLPADQKPLTGDSDRIEALLDREIRMLGGVNLRQGEWYLQAPEATLDQQENVIRIPEGLVLRSRQIAMQGDRANIDMTAQQFRMEDATFLIYSRHARGDAEQMYNEGEDVLLLEDAGYTTCGPNSEDWRMTANTLRLDRAKGEGYATNMALWISDVPVAWFPYLAFPIDDRRRSGFLYPSITNSNVGRGIDLTVPYYFNLDPSYDLTYAPRYIHGRGLLHQIEARHLSEISYSELRAGYISNDREYELSGGRDAHRWAIDFENRTRPAEDWFSVIDLNAVSDSDYLGDLNRTLQINEESFIRRSWQVSHAGDIDFNGQVLAYQTVNDNIAQQNRPYLLLPQLDWRYRTLAGGLSWNAEAEYTYFWRDNDLLTGRNRVLGHRARILPQVALPLRQTWGFLTPKVTVDHTDYLLEDTDLDNHQARTVPFFELDSGLFFDRLTEAFGNRYNQSLEPRLYYVYSPAKFQEDLPDFDTTVATFSYSRLFKADRFVGGDRVGDNNRFTLGLTSRLNDLERGQEVLRGSIGQIIYLEDQEVSLNGKGDSDLSESPLAGELFWRPNQRLDVKVEGIWNTDESATERGSSTLSFHREDYSALLNLSHRYDAVATDPLEQTEISGLYEVTPSIALFGRWAFDLVEHRTIGSMLGLEYSSCCWRVQFLARDALVETEDENGDEQSELDRGYFLRFELRGLGNLSNDLEKVLGEELRNFDERDAFRRARYQW